MENTPQKIISRRDAMKLLTAAVGATALTSLPSEWSKPALAASELPEHARQSLCYAVFVEVLSADGEIFLAIPDVPGNPLPDVVSGSGGTGSTWGWYCQEGCLFFILGSIDTSASVQITTISDQFTLVINSQDPKYVLISLGTGQYSLELGEPAGSCEWPES